MKIKKLYLFGYNKDSFLNNSVVRTMNGIALFIIMAIMASNTSSLLHIKAVLVAMAPLAQSVICVTAIKFVKESITFFEWDYTERKKQKRFYATYLFILVILSGLFVISLLILFSFYEKDMKWLNLLLVIPPLLFAFNICNTISLFYPMFSDDLTLGYKIQKKPEHWQEDGREVDDDMLAEEIMYRDFGINL